VALNPASGELFALILPDMTVESFQAFIDEFSKFIGKQTVARLITDGAGAHRSNRLKIVEQLTLEHLPPYSPELNPIENLWHYIKSHYLSNRAYADYDALLDAGQAAWRSLTPEIIQSVCRCDYLTHEIQR